MVLLDNRNNDRRLRIQKYKIITRLVTISNKSEVNFKIGSTILSLQDETEDFKKI